MSQRDTIHIFSEFEDCDRQSCIQRIITRNPYMIETTRAHVFFLWFCNLDLLRRLASSPELNAADRFSVDGPLPDEKTDVVAMMAKGRRSKQDMSVNQDVGVAIKAMIRDGERCVLTKFGKETAVEATHIVPFKMHGTQQGKLWRHLDFFWGAKAKAWRQAIVGSDNRFNTERVSNMISLNSTVHTLWDNNLCAFRVVQVADDKLSMDIAFHWLPEVVGKRGDSVPLSQNPFGAGAQTKYLKSTGDNFKLFNNDTERLIESGSIFTITTPDKDKYPLPSKELLDLMWTLRRLAAMQGAEEEEEDEEEEDEEEEDEEEEDEEEEDEEEEDKDFPAVPSSSRSRSPVKSPSPLRRSENLGLT